jgi:hypothetical protein
VLDGIDGNPHMPAPNDQVAWMRCGNTPKIIDSFIEIKGTYVGVGETRQLVNLVHQVRTVGLAPHLLSLLPGGVDKRQALIGIQ